MPANPVPFRKTTVYALPVVVFLLAACASAPAPTPRPDVDAPAATATARQRPTLPPTWTLTPTYTATDTPTITLTPSVTDTFTPTATIDPLKVCDEFEVYYEIKEGARIATDGNLALMFRTTRPDVRVEFRAVNRETGEGKGVRVPGGRFFGMNYAASQLPGPGIYDWTLNLSTETDSGLCEHGGSFVLYESEATPEATETN